MKHDRTRVGDGKPRTVTAKLRPRAGFAVTKKGRTEGRPRPTALDKADEALYNNLGGYATARGWYRWVVGLAQSRVASLTPVERRSRTLDLAQFAFRHLGISLRMELATAGSTAWTVSGAAVQNGVPIVVRVIVTAREMERTKSQLNNLLSGIGGRLDLRSNLAIERILRWDKARRRYVVKLNTPWTDLALAHCCELAAQYPSTLRRCAAQGCEKWFVPMPGFPRKCCSHRCEGRERVRKWRQLRRASVSEG
jgi:hypothetical protein